MASELQELIKPRKLAFRTWRELSMVPPDPTWRGKSSRPTTHTGRQTVEGPSKEITHIRYERTSTTEDAALPHPKVVVTWLNKPSPLPRILHFTSLPKETWDEEDTHGSERKAAKTRWYPRRGDKSMCRPAWQGSSWGSSTLHCHVAPPSPVWQSPPSFPFPKTPPYVAFNDYRPITLTSEIMCREQSVYEHFRDCLHSSFYYHQFVDCGNWSTLDASLALTLHLSLSHLENKESYARML